MTHIPSASEIESKIESKIEPDMDALMASLKSLEPSDLFKVMKQALNEAEKRSKNTVSKKSPTSTKKTGSMPKGKVPPQLRKPRAWVDFTLKHALENGWEPFTVHQTKKDKETGEKSEEEILQPGSIMHEEAHVYEGSVTEKNPSGKQLIHKDAMSLSKQRWAPKEATGTHQELYEEFLASYVEEEIPESTSESSNPVVKMTAAEKSRLSEEKKAEKLRLSEEKKAEKLREKEEKKAEKLREKEEKKAEKLREKETKVPTAAITKVVKPATKPVTPTKPVTKEVAPVAAKPVAKKVIVKPTKAKEEWTCPEDGMVHPWPYKGKAYLRNFENEVWLRGEDGACGEWQGVYLPTEDRIDDTVPEPEFEDE